MSEREDGEYQQESSELLVDYEGDNEMSEAPVFEVHYGGNISEIVQSKLCVSIFLTLFLLLCPLYGSY